MSKQDMNGYCHKMPGRLRVRVSNLKNRPETAKSLQLLLLSLPGVAAVRANPVTGNVLARFDAAKLSHDDILRNLADLGHLPLVENNGEDLDEAAAWFSGVGMNLGKTIAKAALKQALAGSPASILLELL